MGFPSKVRHAVDAEPSIVLRQLSAAADTASTNNPAISLNVNDKPFWSPVGRIPFELAAAVVRVTALDKGTGDETYEFQLQVDNDQAFAGGDATTIASIKVNAPGVYVINLDGPTIQALRNNAKFLRISSVLAGTTPIVTYEAWLAPATGNAA